jgi:hypothetical protein
MNEYVEALSRLNYQLAKAGVPAPSAQTTLIAYVAALQHRTETAWRTFYLSIYERLHELAERPLPFVGGAALPLISLLEDDFGTRLIRADERKRIRRKLVEYEFREASLPS